LVPGADRHRSRLFTCDPCRISMCAEMEDRRSET
jgi:hypothetical protein